MTSRGRVRNSPKWPFLVILGYFGLPHFPDWYSPPRAGENRHPGQLPPGSLRGGGSRETPSVIFTIFVSTFWVSILVVFAIWSRGENQPPGFCCFRQQKHRKSQNSRFSDSGLRPSRFWCFYRVSGLVTPETGLFWLFRDWGRAPGAIWQVS